MIATLALALASCGGNGGKTGVSLILKTQSNPYFIAMKQAAYAAMRIVMALTELKPSPDYEKVVETCGGRGEKVEGPKQLIPALERSLEAVRAGTPVTLNVQTQARR